MDLVNPILGLEKLLELFEDGAEKGGTFVDQALCHAAVDGLSDAILAIAQLCSRMEDAGLLAACRIWPRSPIVVPGY